MKEKMNFWDKRDIFRLIPFYNVLIEKHKIKGLKNIDLLHELPFYDELNIKQISKHFGGMQEVIKLK